MTAYGDTLNIGGPGRPADQQTNTYVTTSSSCSIKIFHYKKENPDPESDDSENLEVDVYDINNQDTHNPILSFTYTKSLSSASGYFQFNLLPTTNWFNLIRPMLS